ncbi:MAG: hypothetical protein MJ051_02200 [Akkermansia sp.]|nr:hypothetical protein [Akkermansia sp.]
MNARPLLPLLLLAALPALAGFRTAEQTVKLSPTQTRATVVFETDGSAIRKAKPLCDCTKLETSGTKLIAEVNTATFDSSVDKQIDVRTSDGLTTRLTMHFEVPPAIVLSARSLVWVRGSAPEPQVLTITLPEGSPIRSIKDAGLSGNNYDFVPETVSKGREYRLTVTPKSTEKGNLERLVIKTDCADPRYAQRIIYLQVKAGK